MSKIRAAIVALHSGAAILSFGVALAFLSTVSAADRSGAIAVFGALVCALAFLFMAAVAAERI